MTNTPEGSAMSKPVYQYQTDGMLISDWQDIDEQSFAKLSKDHCYKTRILYPSAAYEAQRNEVERLKAKVECLEGKIELDQAKLRGEEETVKRVVAHSEALQARIKELESKELIKSAAEAARENWALHDKVEALKVENESLKRAQSNDAVDYWDLVSANADRAKQIADLKAENEELRHVNLTSLADLHFKNRELESKNEALRKQVAELKTETAKDHVKIMHLKDALSAYGDPDVFEDDED